MHSLADQTATSRVQWVFPGPCQYVPICLPGFTPDNCGREEEMPKELRQLHARNKYPYLFHMAQKKLWNEAKARD